MSGLTTRMVDSKEVAERLGVCRTTAYKIIRELNDEMEARGCKVITGRVSKELFEQTYFGKKKKGGGANDGR